MGNSISTFKSLNVWWGRFFLKIYLSKTKKTKKTHTSSKLLSWTRHMKVSDHLAPWLIVFLRGTKGLKYDKRWICETHSQAVSVIRSVRCLSSYLWATRRPMEDVFQNEFAWAFMCIYLVYYLTYLYTAAAGVLDHEAGPQRTSDDTSGSWTHSGQLPVCLCPAVRGLACGCWLRNKTQKEFLIWHWWSSSSHGSQPGLYGISVPSSCLHWVRRTRGVGSGEWGGIFLWSSCV